MITFIFLRTLRNSGSYVRLFEKLLVGLAVSRLDIIVMDNDQGIELIFEV